MGRSITNKFSLMDDKELIDYLHKRYKKYGMESLSYPSLKNVKGLYHVLYSRGLKQRVIIKTLGLSAEYKEYKEKTFTKTVKGKVIKRWSWDRVIETLEPIVEQEGFLPPAQWFTNNNLGALVQYVYSSGMGWGELREHFDSFENSNFVTSRNNIRWRSRPEASLSNFLYARGIKHKVGEKYSKEYADFGSASYGYYDMHFKNTSGKWVDVEIWGDKPNGHNEKGYSEVRKSKESFNKTNVLFLGIQFKDCYEDIKLEALLKPYIGIIKPFNFDKPEDRVIQTTHWTDADELIEYCREIAKSQPDGKFPTEEWLRKRGKWKDRDGDTYNTVSIYIKTWIGGVRKLRDILGQGENSTISWDRESALEEYKKWFDEFGFTAGQARTDSRKIDKVDEKRAANISIAVAKYVGPVQEVNKILGINSAIKSKWSKEKILSEFLRIFDTYSLSPSQVFNLSEQNKAFFKVSTEDIQISKQLMDRVGAYFSGVKEVYDTLGVKPIDIRILKKSTA